MCNYKDLQNTDRVQTYRMFVGKKFVCFDHTDWNELTGMLQKQQIISSFFRI